MAYDINVTEFFRYWYERLSEAEQDSVESVVNKLIEAGPHLGFPYSSKINGSSFSHMRELRIQHHGRPYRILYAFDPSREAVLLLGGEKTGDDRWYERMIPKADALYFDYIEERKQERGARRQ